MGKSDTWRACTECTPSLMPVMSQTVTTTRARTSCPCLEVAERGRRERWRGGYGDMKNLHPGKA